MDRFIMVNTPEDLETALKNRTSNIRLSAKEYILKNPLIIDYDCTIEMPDHDVVIRGQNRYGVQIHDARVTIGDNRFGSKLRFDRLGPAHGINIASTSRATEVTLYYCDILRSKGNGLNIMPSVTSESSTVTVTCHKCQSGNNLYDGYSLKNVEGARNRRWQILNLLDCSAFGNDPCGIRNGAGDGVTGHDRMQKINLIGGRYYANGKMGAVPTLGTMLYAKGVRFFGNNQVSPAGNVHVALGAAVVLEDCIFTGLNGEQEDLTHIYVDPHPENFACIKNCRFLGKPSDKGGVYVDVYGGTCIIEDCIFTHNLQEVRPCVRISSNAAFMLEDSVFYNVAKALSISNEVSLIRNNIFSTISGCAIITSDRQYAVNIANTGNIFYQVNEARYFYDSASDTNEDQSHPGDFKNINPQLHRPEQYNQALTSAHEE